MLDERQCRQAVARLFYNNNKDQRDFDLILELINEHFDNPPLKFEELKPNMWVWDNKEDWWRKIKIVFEPCKEYPNGSFKSWSDSAETYLDFVSFEKNCFYKYEVKE